MEVVIGLQFTRRYQFRIYAYKLLQFMARRNMRSALFFSQITRFVGSVSYFLCAEVLAEEVRKFYVLAARRGRKVAIQPELFILRGDAIKL